MLLWRFIINNYLFNFPGKLLSLRLKKGQIDKAHKDKTSQRFPDNFSVTLFLVKPDDQSEKLLDYSLYSPTFLMSMPDQVTPF